MRLGTPLADKLLDFSTGDAAGTTKALRELKDALRTSSITELSAYGSSGSCTYHIAARSGVSIPMSKLNEEVLLLKDREGKTPLHYICEHPWTPDSLAQDISVVNLPLKYMTDKVLFVKDKAGNTPFHNLVAAGGFDLLPKHQRTLKNLLKTNKIGETGLHKAAQTGRLHSLSPDFLTEENLRLKTKTGNTVFHDVMRGGELATLKTSLLTLENLTLQDDDLTTPLHCGTLAQVPKSFLTQETLMLSCNAGDDLRWTVLHGAALRGDLKYIPPELLTPDNLTKKSLKGLLPLEYHINQGLDIEVLPIYKPGWIVKNEEERQKWLKLIEEYSMPMPDSIGKDMSHLEKEGAWAGL